MRIGAGHRVHRVKAHAKARGEQAADRIEIEQRLHQRGIFDDGIDDIDRRALDLGRADRIEIDVGRIGDFVMVDGLGAREDRVGDFFGGRAAIADIVFDAEIAVRAAWVMARRQDDAAIGGASADEAGDGGRRQNAAAADDQMAKSVGGRDLDDFLDRLAVVIAPVAAEHEHLAGKAFERVENRLHEIFDVIGLLENRHLFAQARGARLLIGEWFCFDGADHPQALPGQCFQNQPHVAALALERRPRWRV